MPMYADAHFGSEEGILAVYDFDYEATTDFQYKLQTRTTLMTACIIPYCWPCLPCCACFVFLPMFHDNVQDSVEAQHIAISRDGIKYIVDRHKSLCRLDFQDVGKISKTVPFDKITDCDVEEPAGSSGPICCLVENVLHTVNVDTASGSGGGRELTIRGLKDPLQFKKDVWSMKRGEGIDRSPFRTGTTMLAPAAAIMDDRLEPIDTPIKNPYVSSSTAEAGAGMSSVGERQLLGLMEEQNKLLRAQNKILKDIAKK